jgi:hypothetical protein
MVVLVCVWICDLSQMQKVQVESWLKKSKIERTGKK